MKENFCFKLMQREQCTCGWCWHHDVPYKAALRYTARALPLTFADMGPDQVHATWLMLLKCSFSLTELPSRIKWKGIHKSLTQGRFWLTVVRGNECRAGVPGFTEQPNLSSLRFNVLIWKMREITVLFAKCYCED